MFIEEAFCLYKNEVLHFNFSSWSGIRSAIDNHVEIRFTLDKHELDDNGIFHCSLNDYNKNSVIIKVLNHLPINSYGLPSIRNDLSPLYSDKIIINQDIVTLFNNLYHNTRNISFAGIPSYYHSNIFSDYQLAIKAIEIGGYGNAIFLLISFVEKFFKSYLKNLSYTEEQFRIIGHNIKNGWNEVKKTITFMKAFDQIYFNNKINQLSNLYKFDLRYDSGNYNILSAIKANDLSLEIINYFIDNTEHNLIPEDYDWYK